MNKLKEQLFKGGAEKEEGLSSFVLELRLHCDGCVQKIKKILRKYDGVEDVIADLSSDTMTVIGKADPYEVREKLEDSPWCLNELAKIMECHRSMGKIVVPVFYDVDPSEVRNQKGVFGKAFQNLLNKISKKEDESLSEEKEEGESLSDEEEKDESRLSELSWRKALRGAASIAGFALLNSRNESKAIKDITEEITHLLDKT